MANEHIGDYVPGAIDTVFVQSVLSRITYKGWNFTLSGGGGRHLLYLHATTSGVDSRTGEPDPTQVRRWPIDWPPQATPDTEAQVVAWVRHAVHEWEAHEVDEWLRLDGELIHDPHECPQCLIGGCRA